MWSNFIVLGTSFGFNFLYISQLPESSYFATGIMRNAWFYLSRAPISRSQIHPQIMFFQDCTSIFQVLCGFYKKIVVWGTLKNPVGANMGHQRDQVAPNCQTKICFLPALDGFMCRLDLMLFLRSSFDGDWLMYFLVLFFCVPLSIQLCYHFFLFFFS